MSRTAIPTADARLLAFTENVSAQITQTPGPFGLQASDCLAYAALQSDYSDKLKVASDPATRTKLSVEDKRVSKKALLRATRALNKRVAGFPQITDRLLMQLGFSVRAPAKPIGAPQFAPGMLVKGVVNNTVTLRLVGPDAERRGLPLKVAGATVFSFTGPEKPVVGDVWKFEASTTKMDLAVPFDPALPAGTVVHFCAFFKNERDQSGPIGQPISATLAGTAILPTPITAGLKLVA